MPKAYHDKGMTMIVEDISISRGDDGKFHGMALCVLNGMKVEMDLVAVEGDNGLEWASNLTQESQRKWDEAIEREQQRLQQERARAEAEMYAYIDSSNESIPDRSNSSLSNGVDEFRTQQDVYIAILNKSYTSNGLTISFDSSGQMYMNGNWVAGAVEVPFFNSRQATVQYNSPQLGRGSFILRIRGNSLEIYDSADGSTYYQD